MARFVETDLSTRIYRVSTGLNECMTVMANEPSVGLYRIQENVLGTVPKLVEERQSMDILCQKVNGCNFDLDNDREVVSGMKDITKFKDIQNVLKKAIAIKQQLNRIESERQLAGSTARVYPNTPTSPISSLPVNAVTIQSSTPTQMGGAHPGRRIANYQSINDSNDASGIIIQPKSFT